MPAGPFGRLRAMRLAFVSASLSRSGGGVSSAVEGLSKHVAEAGIDVAVFGPEDADWLNHDRQQWGGAEPIALKRFGPSRLAWAPSLTRRLTAWKPDLVHTHGLWLPTSGSVLSWAKSTGKPYVISPHGMLDRWAVQNAQWKKQIAGLLFENANLRRADCIHALCVSEERAIRAFGLGNPIEVIPNGILVPNPSALLPAPWANHVPSDSRVMVFLGRIHPKKNLEAFLRVWAALRGDATKGEKWYLVIAGWSQAGYEEHLKTVCSQLELNGGVLFAGPAFGDTKVAMLQNANAFVLPSLSEGLPMAVLEAWAYGLPTLMTDECNLPEGFLAGAAQRLRHGDHSMAIDLRDFLSMDRARADQMSKSARRLVDDKFHWSKVARMHIDLYRRLVGGRSDSRSEAHN